MSDELRLIRAGIDEIDLLVRSRVDFCLRDRPGSKEEEVNAFIPQVESWTKKNLQNGNYIGYLGFVEAELVCCAGLLFYTLPPLISELNRKQGHVLTFFTYPQFRSRGIGAALMKFIIEDSKSLGVKQLVLNATQMGESLYEKSGFHNPKFRSMVLSV